MNPWLLVTLAVWLVVMSACDLRTRQVPNWLTIPPLLAILAWQLAHCRWQVLLALPLIYSLWHLYILGGADAKVLATLFACRLPIADCGTSHCGTRKADCGIFRIPKSEIRNRAALEEAGAWGSP